jgi:hypothetical protein
VALEPKRIRAGPMGRGDVTYPACRVPMWTRSPRVVFLSPFISFRCYRSAADGPMVSGVSYWRIVKAMRAGLGMEEQKIGAGGSTTEIK